MNNNDKHSPAKPVFYPPSEYIRILRLAIEAGYTPTDAQKRWLVENEQSREKNYEPNVS